MHQIQKKRNHCFEDEIVPLESPVTQITRPENGKSTVFTGDSGSAEADELGEVGLKE